MPKTYTAPFRLLGDSETVLVHMGGTQEDADRSFADSEAKALRNGDTVVYNDGRRVWRERTALTDSNAEGSDRYTWHDDGNRVRCVWYEHTLTPDGKKSSRKLRSCWVNYDEAV